MKTSRYKRFGNPAWYALFFFALTMGFFVSSIQAQPGTVKSATLITEGLGGFRATFG
jgi:hypothetical protein